MHLVLTFVALAMTGCAAALPQILALKEVAQIPGAPLEKAPLGGGASTQIISYALDPVISNTFASVLANPASASKKGERRGVDCSEQPRGKGPIPTPDTPEAFLAMGEISNAANNAPTPSGYTLKFKNLKASNNAIGYLGYNNLDTYDTQACADLCTAKEGCLSFNIYFERDPSLVPANACPNPASTTIINCVMWGSYIGPGIAVNDGQWRNDFHIVIAGSNGYVDERVPTVPGYSGEYLNNAAIDAPSDCNGDDTYIGFKLFNDGKPFSVQRCAAACEAETQYNIEHLNSRVLCRYFNTYVLNKNGVLQGQYCSMYTQTWDKTYATNKGGWRGDDHYTIEYSYSFSNTTDPGKSKLPCDVAAPKSAVVASSL